MENLFIDIETIPVQSAELAEILTGELNERLVQSLETMRAPSNYKDPAKIDEYLKTTRERLIAEHKASTDETLERTSLDGGFGQCVAIAYAIDDSPAQSITVDSLVLDDERECLDLFFRGTVGPLTFGMPPRVIGHNHAGFDLPFLYKRAVIHGLALPGWWPLDPKPWDTERTYDTMARWAGREKHIGLQKLSRILGIRKSKAEGPTGADVWRLVQSGDLATVAAKARDDVELTRAIYHRMVFGAR